jgi:small conductance mechanosensitive channel
MRQAKGALDKPPPEAIVVALAESSVTIRARWWIQPPRQQDTFAAIDEVLEIVKAKLQSNGVDLPFPTRQILFHDQTEETDGDRARQREGWPAGKGNVPKPNRVSDALEAIGSDGDQKKNASTTEDLKPPTGR